MESFTLKHLALGWAIACRPVVLILLCQNCQILHRPVPFFKWYVVDILTTIPKGYSESVIIHIFKTEIHDRVGEGEN